MKSPTSRTFDELTRSRDFVVGDWGQEAIAAIPHLTPAHAIAAALMRPQYDEMLRSVLTQMGGEGEKSFADQVLGSIPSQLGFSVQGKSVRVALGAVGITKGKLDTATDWELRLTPDDGFRSVRLDFGPTSRLIDRELAGAGAYRNLLDAISDVAATGVAIDANEVASPEELITRLSVADAPSADRLQVSGLRGLRLPMPADLADLLEVREGVIPSDLVAELDAAGSWPVATHDGTALVVNADGYTAVRVLGETISGVYTFLAGAGMKPAAQTLATALELLNSAALKTWVPSGPRPSLASDGRYLPLGIHGIAPAASPLFVRTIAALVPTDSISVTQGKWKFAKTSRVPSRVGIAGQKRWGLGISTNLSAVRVPVDDAAVPSAVWLTAGQIEKTEDGFITTSSVDGLSFSSTPVLPESHLLVGWAQALSASLTDAGRGPVTLVRLDRHRPWP